MVVIDNILINSSYLEILNSFKLYINSMGIRLLDKINDGVDNIMITCPFHKDGQERKPSCGVSKKDGVVHCFTCGTVKSFTQMLSFCLGYNDNGEMGKQWIINNIESNELEQRDLNFKLSRDKEIINYVSEEELDTYRYYHPYMYQRKLTNEIINKFDVGYDKRTNSITFPVRDIKGNTLFIARRNVAFKNFNYPSGAVKPLYGIYEMTKNAKSIIICESIFNCLTCYVYGKEALALNGTGTKEQIEELSKLSFRTIYLGLDNDEAGNKGCLRIKNKLGNKFLFKRMIFPEGKDINDLNEEEFNKIYDSAIKF